MTLIKSISGIRGTIGGKPGEGLTPLDVVKFTSAYAAWVQENGKAEGGKIIVGRDARTSGEMVRQLVCGTLSGMGMEVVDLGLATTPTVEIAVAMEGAQGGIILTASHNPGEWNALKLLNGRGEFISAEDGQRILKLAADESFNYAAADKTGGIVVRDDYAQRHIGRILDLELVDPDAIRKAGLRVVVDCVNSVGGLILPSLLRQLGVKEVIELYCEPSGRFPHNPEPLPENLGDLSHAVVQHKADVGLAVDPDVDRLAIVDEKGKMFGEEYTLVAVADYILGKTPGNTVSNLSSTRALKDVTEKHGGRYFASAVGEVNVVNVMKQNRAVIGGEGNGGVIYPRMHYGRDALTGTALFLTHLAGAGATVSRLKTRYPEYFISKNKVGLDPSVSLDRILEKVAGIYKRYELNREDGLKIDMPGGWIHLRKSNTEPIIRIYTEAGTQEEAGSLAEEVMDLIRGDHSGPG
jgi:phosphomannomutase